MTQVENPVHLCRDISRMIKKLNVSKNATKLLENYYNKTGLRPNIVARNAMMYSLSKGDIYSKLDPPKTDGKEFNLYTLFGENENYYYLLIKQYYLEEFSKFNLAELVSYHIEMGLSNDIFINVIKGELELLKY